MLEEKNFPDSAQNKQEEHLSYLCDRAQKITKAVYRVTDMLPDQEPLKWKIRESALSVFGGLSSLQNKNFLERIPCLKSLGNALDEVVLLLSLVGGDNSISSINFEMLKDEYTSIKKYVEKENKSKSFEEMFLPDAVKEIGGFKGRDLIGQDNGQSNGQDNGQVNTDKKTIYLPAARRISPGADDRKSKILETVKEKRRVTISEVSNIFPECSEKTIQRDLLEMVSRGVLKKEGDKRWRTYSIDTV